MRELFEGSGVSMLGLGIPLKGTTKYSLSYTTFGSQKLSVYSGQFSQDIDVNILKHYSKKDTTLNYSVNNATFWQIRLCLWKDLKQALLAGRVGK